MLRRDINLLYSLTQATKKKSSSNLMLVLVVGVVLIIGLMTFLFVDAKMTVEKNQSLLDDINGKLGQSAILAQKQKEYNELKALYEKSITEIISELSPQQYALTGAKMSKTLVDVLMLTDTEQDGVDADYDGDDIADAVFDVEIAQLVISGNIINLECRVEDYVAAWDFVDYLAGNKIAARPALDALVEKNKLYFVDVESNYSGLPTAPSAEGEKIDFTLKFSVNWEALQ